MQTIKGLLWVIGQAFWWLVLIGLVFVHDLPLLIVCRLIGDDALQPDKDPGHPLSLMSALCRAQLARTILRKDFHVDDDQ